MSDGASPPGGDPQPGDALLAQQIALLERSFKMVDEEHKRALADLRSELATFREQHNSPWYKDRRFWAGISTVPALLLGGWLVKTVSGGDPIALRLLHKAFGTEPALSSALKDDRSEFTMQLETTVGKGLQGKTGTLAGALEGFLKDKRVLTEGTLVPALSKELREHVGGRHASFHSVGLVDPSRARTYVCEPKKWCLDAKAGQTRSATIVFAASPGKKVDIDLGINVRRYDLDANGKFDPADGKDVTDKVKLSELLIFKLDDGERLPLKPIGQIQRYIIDGNEYKLDQLSSKEREIGSKAFPMRSLSLEVARDVPSSYVIHVGVVISQTN